MTKPVDATTRRVRAPDLGWSARLWALNDWILHRLPVGPAIASPRQAINLHKLSVGPVTAALMYAFDDSSLAAWLYLALHGTYGVMWVAKDVAFGDRSWRGAATVGSAVAIFIWPLGLYYVPALLIITPLGEWIPGGWGAPEPPPPLVFAAVTLFVLGAFFHFVSDAQKFYVLANQQPRRLITDGMFALTRNPNYLGEVMIYASFNVLAQHWLPWVTCSFVWLLVFLVNIRRKEESMSRYPEHADWARRTGFLLPSVPGLVRRMKLIVR